MISVHDRRNEGSRGQLLRSHEIQLKHSYEPAGRLLDFCSGGCSCGCGCACVCGYASVQAQFEKAVKNTPA